MTCRAVFQAFGPPPPCRTAIHLGGVHESPSIEQAESVLVAVAEASLVGDPVRAVVLVLTAQGSW